MAYELTAHDRGVIAAWKPKGGHIIFLCPVHGVWVEKKEAQTGVCWCGEWCVEYKPEDYADSDKKKKGKDIPQGEGEQL